MSSASIAREKSNAGVRAALDRVDAAAARDDAEAVPGGAQVGQPGPAAPRGVVALDLADRARLLLAADHHDPPARPPPRRCRRAAFAMSGSRSQRRSRGQVALGDLEVAATRRAAGEHVERAAGHRAGEVLAREAPCRARASSGGVRSRRPRAVAARLRSELAPPAA